MAYVDFASRSDVIMSLCQALHVDDAVQQPPHDHVPLRPLIALSFDICFASRCSLLIFLNAQLLIKHGCKSFQWHGSCMSSQVSTQLQLVIHDAGENSASIVDTISGQELFSARTMDSIWLELAADSSAAHGPKLRIRLVSSQHPAVQQASIKAAYPQRTERHQQPSSLMADKQLGAGQTLPARADMSKQQPRLHGKSESLDVTVAKQSLDGANDVEGNAQSEDRQKPAALGLQKPRPGRKAKTAEPELGSIAAVLNAVDSSLQADVLWDAGMMPANEVGITAAVEDCPKQLVSRSGSPCVALLEHAEKRTLLQAYWQLGLRIAKMSARADAALSWASSDRMTRLQTEMCELCAEMRKMQKQLQNA